MTLTTQNERVVASGMVEDPYLPADTGPFACTVVICTKNRPAALRQCLKSLQDQLFQSFEILVVDNSPAPTQARDVAHEFDARYMLCPSLGLSHARNAGLRAARSEFVAFLDDDAIPESEWLLRLLGEFSLPEIVAVTGQIILERDGHSTALNPRGYARIDKDTPQWFEMANFGGIGSGSNMAFRRSALNYWSGFEERLGRGQLLDAWEDDYAFFRLVHEGFSIVYAPTARVRHPEPISDGTVRSKLHPIAISTAYVTLLACEHPNYIPKICRFLIDAARRTPRAWRSRSRKAFNTSVPALLVYSALLFGPFIYFYMRLANIFKSRRRGSLNPLHSQVPSEP
jgi:glycosyltransferase involved in cell wall biosynthesis